VKQTKPCGEASLRLDLSSGPARSGVVRDHGINGPRNRGKRGRSEEIEGVRYTDWERYREKSISRAGKVGGKQDLKVQGGLMSYQVLSVSVGVMVAYLQWRIAMISQASP